MTHEHDDALISVDLNVATQALEHTSTDEMLFQTIVDTPFKAYPMQTALMFLGIAVLLQVNPKTNSIDRVALSNTELAKNTTNVSYVPFDQIRIPADDQENIIAKAITTDTPQDTTDWKFLFTPALSAEQARLNQASGGIAYSAVYPLSARNGGAMIFSYFQYEHNIGKQQHDFMQQYVKIVNEALKK